jgi:hypothetical protein
VFQYWLYTTQITLVNLIMLQRGSRMRTKGSMSRDLMAERHETIDSMKELIMQDLHVKGSSITPHKHVVA